MSEDVLITAQRNVFTARGLVSSYLDKRPNERAKTVAIMDQIRSIAMSSGGLELATLLLNQVSCETDLKYAQALHQGTINPVLHEDEHE